MSGMLAKNHSREPRLRRPSWPVALFLVIGFLMGGTGIPAVQAAELTVVATGEYGGCPAKLWSNGVLEFTGATITNPDNDSMYGANAWTGDLGSYGALSRKYKDSIKSVKSGPIKATGTLQRMFEGAGNLTDIAGLAKWDVSGVSVMSSMFKDAASLTNIDPLAQWDMSNVVRTEYMFYGAKNLVSLDALAKWDVSSIVTMYSMFWGAEKLISIEGIKNWDTSSIGYYSYYGGWDGLFDADYSIKTAAFVNPTGFTSDKLDPLDLSWPRELERLTIGKGAKPNLELPILTDWKNTTRGDGRLVPADDLAALIKSGAGEGVWVRYEPVSSLYVSTQDYGSLKTGASRTLTVQVWPEDATDKAVAWASSNPAIATVDANGKVTGVKAGTATITATAKDGSGTSGSYLVTVVSAPVPSVLPSSGASGGSGQCVVKSGPASFRDVPGSYSFVSDVSWLSRRGITTGWSDGTFRPYESVSRAAFAAFLYRMAGCPDFTPPVVSPFKDVPVTHQFYREISWMAAKGISTGYSDGSFRPEAKIRRDALSTFLYRFAGKPQFTVSKSFRDTGTSEHRVAIDWFASTGISTGWPDGTFRPNNETERGAIAAFLHRFDQKKIPIAVR